MNGSSYSLINVREHARRTPGACVPTEHETRSLQRTDRARLVFCEGAATERLWVEVFSGGGDADYFGTLLGAPDVMSLLARGDVVRFSAEHVLECLYSEEVEGQITQAQARHDAAHNADWESRQRVGCDCVGGCAICVGGAP